MNSKINFNLSNFETVSETSGEKLVGGFSFSFSNNISSVDEGSTSNNCAGGNCKADCGMGQNIQCNTVAGCA